MEWFQGSIPEAIQSSKARKAYFVVYVEGTDDSSKTTTEVLDRPAVSSKLKGPEFVCIKLPKDSEGHKQFAEIYKMVPVPSVFFIALNGRATEVVVGKTDDTSLENLLSSAIEKCVGELKLEVASTQSAPVIAPISPSASAVSSASPQPSSSSLSAVSSASVVTENPKEIISQPTEAPPSLDDRVEKAKQLINQKNEEKRKEEIEKEKAAERERRRVGQEMHKAKLSRQELEMKEALEERKKNSIQEQAARKKILDQIAQDRADRLERERMRAPVVSPSVVAAPSAPPPSDVNSARIQFRLPSGETKNHVFQADTTITQIREFIDNNIVLPFREYRIATTFPRREFTWRENGQDLRSLQLLPSAVLLIVPVSGNVVSRPNGWANAMISLFWSVLAPFLSVGNYVSSFIFGGGNGRPATTGPRQAEPAGPQPSAPPTSSSQSQSPYGSRTNN
uniref:UBX domain-containing protein 4 n=2 Tax=Lygus hesperus TaxID=30085 RepID=A0A0A9WAL0_LYGHE